MLWQRLARLEVVALVASSLHQRILVIVSTPKLPPRHVPLPLGHPSQGLHPSSLSHLSPQNLQWFFSSGARAEAGFHHHCPPSEQ